MSETKNKELTANGFSCLNHALSQDLVLFRITNEFPGFKDRIDSIANQF